MIAVIPVRKGSQRVENKNSKDFAGSSLLKIKIEQVKRVGVFDDIVVSSDSDEMLEIAARLGVGAHVRDPVYCMGSTPMKEVYRYLGKEFSSYKDLAYINVTNPLLKDESLTSCVSVYKNRMHEVVSVNTVHEVKDFMWYSGKPVNYDPANQPRSQDLPEYVALNFACNIISTNIMMHQGVIVGTPHIGIVIDKIQAVDIDDVYDFEIAETLYLNALNELKRF